MVSRQVATAEEDVPPSEGEAELADLPTDPEQLRVLYAPEPFNELEGVGVGGKLLECWLDCGDDKVSLTSMAYTGDLGQMCGASADKLVAAP